VLLRATGATPTGALGGGYVDPSATATINSETLITGKLGAKSNNDVWETITAVP
jgi:hypothetical protein